MIGQLHNGTSSSSSSTTTTTSLVIDVSGEIFNEHNLCVRNFTTAPPPTSERRQQQTFVLTILTAKLKQYINQVTERNQKKNSANETSTAAAAAAAAFLRYKRTFLHAELDDATEKNATSNKATVRRTAASVKTNGTNEFIIQIIRRFYTEMCWHQNAATQQLMRCKQIDPTECRRYLEATTHFTRAEVVDIVCDTLADLDATKRRRSKRNDDDDAAAATVCPFILFSLFDFLVTLVQSEATAANAKFEYVILTMADGAFVWPPRLVLDAAMLNEQAAAFNNLQPHLVDRMWQSVRLFWQCGIRCSAIAALVVVVFLFSTCGCVAVGIAVR